MFEVDLSLAMASMLLSALEDSRHSSLLHVNKCVGSIGKRDFTKRSLNSTT